MTLLDDQLVVEPGHSEAEALFEEAHRRRRRRRLGVGASVAALGAAGLTAALVFGVFTTDPLSSGHAHGDLAGLPVGSSVAPSGGVGLAMVQTSFVDKVQVDVSADFHLRLRQRATHDRLVEHLSFGPYRFASTQAKSAWLATGLSLRMASRTVTTKQGVELFGSKVLDESSLPTTTPRLERVLRTTGSRALHLPGSYWATSPLSSRIVQLLLGPDVGSSAQLESALCTLLPHAPGVSSLGTVTAHDGRRGNAYELSGVAAAGAAIPVVVLDQASGKLLEVRNWPTAISPFPITFDDGFRSHGAGFSTSVVWFDPTSAAPG